MVQGGFEPKLAFLRNCKSALERASRNLVVIYRELEIQQDWVLQRPPAVYSDFTEERKARDSPCQNTLEPLLFPVIVGILIPAPLSN